MKFSTARKRIIKILDELESQCTDYYEQGKASADRPQGEWERIQYSFAGGYRCSICGQKSIDNYYNYCPNCGAKMKGADDVF